MVPALVVANPGGFSNPNNALTIGDYNVSGRVLTADTSAASSKTITLGGVNATAIPAGMVIQNVPARISHTEDFGVGAPRVSFTNGQSQSCGSATTLKDFTPLYFLLL